MMWMGNSQAESIGIMPPLDCMIMTGAGTPTSLRSSSMARA